MSNPVPGAAAMAAVRNAAQRRAQESDDDAAAPVPGPLPVPVPVPGAEPVQDCPGDGSTPPEFVLTISCPDRPGIVARVTRLLYENGGNIEESQQFDDARSDYFFMRIRFSAVEDTKAIGAAEGVGSAAEGLADQATVQVWRERMAPIAQEFGMTWELWSATAPYRALLMVSKAGHCLNDLLFRWQTGALNMTIPAIVSNHRDLEPLARSYGIPFHHIPITAEAKAQAEDELMALVEEHDVDLVVLARYMQVLSDRLCQRMSGRIINIHHSFLPSFKGGKPYHQAFERGVKLVGATAHYVTADLDEGPIIEQDVTRVDHRMGPSDLVRAGQDVEADVLSRAVKWHCDSRVILNTDRTVVFS